MEAPGAHQHPDAGVVHQQVEAERDQQADAEQHQPVGGVRQVGQQPHRPGERGGRRSQNRRRSPDRLHRVVGDQDEAEGGDDLGEMVARVEPAHDQDFEDPGDRHGRRHGDQHRPDEAAAALMDAGGEVGAGHVQRTMGQVHGVHDAEHQGQAGGEQEQHQAVAEAVEELFENENGVHWAK